MCRRRSGRARSSTSRSGGAGSAEELLAVVLGSGGQGNRCFALARDLLGAIGGLPGLIDVDVHELCQLRGVGMSLACRLIAALALGRRALELPLSGRRRLSTPRQVYQHLLRARAGCRRRSSSPSTSMGAIAACARRWCPPRARSTPRWCTRARCSVPRSRPRRAA
ncbi:MAG: UPF0758 domain-containing protein [Planctomycetota bacterium]